MGMNYFVLGCPKLSAWHPRCWVVLLFFFSYPPRPTQRQWCRNLCLTSLSEWAIAGGRREGKSMLLPGLEDCATRREPSSMCQLVDGEASWRWVEEGNAWHLGCCYDSLGWPGMKWFMPISSIDLVNVKWCIWYITQITTGWNIQLMWKRVADSCIGKNLR